MSTSDARPNLRNGSPDDDDFLTSVVDRIGTDPDGVWLALQGLGAVEPAVRARIVKGIVSGPLGAGVVEFLRLLVYAHDRPTRDVALEALARPELTTPEVESARHDLLAHHPDPSVASALRPFVQADSREPGGPHPTPTRLPRLVGSLVAPVDGLGRGTVVLSAERGGERVTAAFLCSVEGGVIGVAGDVARSPAGDAGDAMRGWLGGPDAQFVEGADALAVGLLAGSLLLRGPDTPPVLRYWLEATVGPGLRPSPFAANEPGWDPNSVAFEEMAGRAEAVLSACPGWVDSSPLTDEIARELLLREGGRSPDAGRDPGAYRYLFEHRLKGRLEVYRRMLLWMWGYWHAAGESTLARSALALATQLGDEQHVVPGHPFTVGLTTRSLAAAQSVLRRP